MWVGGLEVNFQKGHFAELFNIMKGVYYEF